MAGATELADRVRKWLGTTEEVKAKDDADPIEVEAARYTAAAAARLWVLNKLASTEADDRDGLWKDVKHHADLADENQDEANEDDALFHRAQANIIALRAFEDFEKQDGAEEDSKDEESKVEESDDEDSDGADSTDDDSAKDDS